jgi:hypothetical protein
MMRSNLARAIADSAWSLFATQLSYKASWYGALVTVADRFYPSTRRCSACGVTGAAVPFSERNFCCASQNKMGTEARLVRAEVPVADTRPTATRTLQHAWRNTLRCWRPAIGLTSPRSTRRR